jgi:hypothetical protein
LASRPRLPPYRFPRLRGFSLRPGLPGNLSVLTNLFGVSLRFRALLPIRILCPVISISAENQTRSPRKVPRFFGGFLPLSGYSPSQAFLATLPFPRTSWPSPNSGPVGFKRNLAVTNLVPPLKLHPSEVSPFRQPSPSRGTCLPAVSTAARLFSNGKYLDDANGEVVIIRFLSWVCAFRSFRPAPISSLLPASSPRTLRCPSESCFLTNQPPCFQATSPSVLLPHSGVFRFRQARSNLATGRSSRGLHFSFRGLLPVPRGVYPSRNRRLPYASLPHQPSLPDSRCVLKPDVAISPRLLPLNNHSGDSVSFSPQRRPFGTSGSEVGSDPVV